MDSFTHEKRYTFVRQEKDWRLDACWPTSDLYHEVYLLTQEGIPEEAMKIEHMPWERRGWHRLTIDFSANVQIEALVERLVELHR